MRDAQSQTRTRAMLVTALGTEIVAALDDPAVVEIMINPDGRLWIERHGSGRTESGLIVTAGDVERVIKTPRHPYTQLLVRSIPLPDPKRRWGEVPDADRREDEGLPISAPTAAGESDTPADDVTQTEASPGADSGCVFASRCPHVMPRCREQRPSLVLTDPGRAAACYLYEEAAVLSQEQVAQLSHGGG